MYIGWPSQSDMVLSGWMCWAADLFANSTRTTTTTLDAYLLTRKVSAVQIKEPTVVLILMDPTQFKRTGNKSRRSKASVIRYKNI